MLVGVCIYEWENYNSFISVIQVIIKNNISIIEKNQEAIRENLKIWSKYQIKSKIWKHLNVINKKKIYKIKKIQEQAVNDNYIQLNFLKKG